MGRIFKGWKAARPRARRKYGNEKVKIGDLTFDSKAEARRWCELVLLARSGSISDLKRQVRIWMIGGDGDFLRGASGRRLSLVVDFAYIEAGAQIYEDKKGFQTKDFKIKQSILERQGIILRLT